MVGPGNYGRCNVARPCSSDNVRAVLVAARSNDAIASGLWNDSNVELPGSHPPLFQKPTRRPPILLAYIWAKSTITAL